MSTRDDSDPVRRLATLFAQAAALPRLIVNWALPPTCLVCRRPVGAHGALCPECWRTVTFIEQPLCDRLGLPLDLDMGPGALSAEAVAAPPAFGRARAAFLYDEAGRALITGLKFSDRLHLAEPMGRWMARAGRDILAGADVIAPVPLHWRRLAMRTFNQAALLARAVSRQSGIALDTALMVRVKPTRHQIGLHHRERRANVAEAFALAKGRDVAGKQVVLVDDVLTTGATLEACARVLTRAGAVRVDVLTAARARRDGI